MRKNPCIILFCVLQWQNKMDNIPTQSVLPLYRCVYIVPSVGNNRQTRLRGTVPPTPPRSRPFFIKIFSTPLTSGGIVCYHKRNRWKREVKGIPSPKRAAGGVIAVRGRFWMDFWGQAESIFASMRAGADPPLSKIGNLQIAGWHSKRYLLSRHFLRDRSFLFSRQ